MTTVILALVGSSLVLSPLSPIAVPVGAETANAGQQVINYYQSLFNYDWGIGTDYDFATAGEMVEPTHTPEGSCIGI